MEVVENENFKPEITNKEIKYLQYDYELHLKDLENLKVEYDIPGRKIFASFNTIYLNGFEYLVKINAIIGSFKFYELNAFYEKNKNILKKVSIGDDIVEYLFQKEKKFLETCNINRIKENFVEI